MSQTYRIITQDSLLFSGSEKLSRVLFFHDYYEDNELRKIERQKRLNSHLQRGDYFESLAISLDLLKNICPKNIQKLLSYIVEDLNYLQENYNLKEKN